MNNRIQDSLISDPRSGAHSCSLFLEKRNQDTLELIFASVTIPRLLQIYSER
jgi:hypothetical protein